MAAVSCPHCGYANVPGAKFCAACGTALPAEAEQPQAQGRFCAACGRQNAPGAQFCASCGQPMSTPSFAGMHQAPAPSTGYAPSPFAPPVSTSPYYATSGGVYAGFWIRVAAYLIDGLIIGIPLAILDAAVFASSVHTTTDAYGQTHFSGGGVGAIYLIGIVVSWLYFALQESGAKQATVGKRAVGIYVTDERGQRIGFGRASGRFFGKILSGLILDIGFIMVAFTQRKQGLHDMLASTLVLRR